MKNKLISFQSFCTYCGKEGRTVSLIPMQHGWAWYCFPCQLRYMFRSRRHRKQIAQMHYDYCRREKMPDEE